MASLQDLKIPRGDRGDWPLKDYSLIDYVESVLNEIISAREGYTTLLQNFQDRYATKTFVETAIGNPTIESVYVTDLQPAPAEDDREGYSLQAIGGTLQFSNQYTAKSGSLSYPGYAFTDYTDAGFSMSSEVSGGTTKSKLSVSIAGIEIGTYQYDNTNETVSYYFLSNSGDIISYNANGTITVNSAEQSSIGKLSVPGRLSSTGTSANRTNIAELRVGGYAVFEGVGVNAVDMAELHTDEFSANKATFTGTGLSKTIIADQYVTKLQAVGTGTDKTVLAEASVTALDVTNLTYSRFITADTTINVTNESTLRSTLAELKHCHVSSGVIVTVQLPAGGITLTSNLDIGQHFGSSIKLKWNNCTLTDALNLGQYNLTISGTDISIILDSPYITMNNSNTLGALVISEGSTVEVYTPVVISNTASSGINADTIGISVDSATLLIANKGQVSSRHVYFSNIGYCIKGSQATIRSYVDGAVVAPTWEGSTKHGFLCLTNNSNFSMDSSSLNYGSLLVYPLSMNGSSVFGMYAFNLSASRAYWYGSVTVSNNTAYAAMSPRIATLNYGSHLAIVRNATINNDAITTNGGLDPYCLSLYRNSDLDIGGTLTFNHKYSTNSETGSAVLLVTDNSNATVADIYFDLEGSSSYVTAYRVGYGVKIDNNGELVSTGTVLINAVASLSCISVEQGGQFTHRGTSFQVGGHGNGSDRVSEGVKANNASYVGIIDSSNTVFAYCATGIRADKMSSVFIPAAGVTYTSNTADISPNTLGVVGNQNALISTN